MDVIAFSGLPRTGSTLLSSILNQNPAIRSEGFSPVCRMLWDTYSMMNNDIYYDEILSSNRDFESLRKDILISIFNTYYKNIKQEKYIFEKSVSWTLPANQNLVKYIFGQDTKTLIMTREIKEIIKSYINIFQKNNIDINYENLFDRTPIIRAFSGLISTYIYPSKNFLYIDYSELISDAPSTIDKIYDFIGAEPYFHNFDNIKCTYPENELYLNIKGINNVRKNISFEKYEVEIPQFAMEKIEYFNMILNFSKNCKTNKDKEICLSFIKDNIFN